MEMVDKIALALCGYGLPGEPCESPCEFCLGQADEVMKVINGYSEKETRGSAESRKAVAVSA
jgi:hypothetical protein